MTCKTRKIRKPRQPRPHADPGWQYVVENWDRLRLLCARLGRKYRPDLIEDLVSEIIVDRVPGIVRRWDPNHPSGMPLKMWVDQGVRKYISKWFKARGIREATHEVLPNELISRQPVPNPVEGDLSADEILSMLSPLDRNVLTASYIDGMTNSEIAKAIGSKSKSRGHELVEAAIVRARQAAMGAALQRSIAYRARRSNRGCDTTTSPIASERATTGIGNGSTIRGPSC